MRTAPRVMPRIGTPRSPSRPSLGPLLAQVADEMGLSELYFWQQYFSDVSLELVPRPRSKRRRLHFDNAGAEVSRQSGKTKWAAARVTTQALLPEYDLTDLIGGAVQSQHIGYLAQHRAAAVAKWEEIAEIIMESPLAELVARLRRANGEQTLDFTNGSWFRPVTPNRTGARGLDLDLAIVDEALAHPVSLLSALRPTMAQRDGSTLGIGAQLVILSSAGDEDSELLDRMTELGRAAVLDPKSRRCWMEWSAEPDCDHLSEAVWRSTIPTLGVPEGIGIEFLRSEAASMPEQIFRQEYLCIPLRSGSTTVISAEVWAACERADVIVPVDGQVLAIDITPERNGAALVAAGGVGGYVAVEVIEARDGVDWVLDRTVEVAERWNAPVALDVVGPAASLIPSLEGRGVTVLPMGTKDATAAAAAFYDGVLARRVTHLGDWRLTDAVAGASKRAVGDRWLWDRRRSGVNISPLVAASLAVWGVAKGEGGVPSIH